MFNLSVARFLADAGDTVVPKVFVFDHLNFEMGSTKLTPESEPTVKDLIVILSAYPTTGVRFDGHTDNVGVAAANKKLSLDRADAIEVILVVGGVEARRLDAQGFGQTRPIAPNSTEDGRARTAGSPEHRAANPAGGGAT